MDHDLRVLVGKLGRYACWLAWRRKLGLRVLVGMAEELVNLAVGQRFAQGGGNLAVGQRFAQGDGKV